MKVKAIELAGTPLDAAVALALGGTNLRHDTVCTWWVTLDGKDRALSSSWAQSFCPSSNWAHGGPIIEAEDISIAPWGENSWAAKVAHAGGAPKFHQYGLNPLLAAMRCLVASKFGDEVDLPDAIAAAV